MTSLGLDLVYRPSTQLHDYPIDVRWEVSRRHPYYLQFWELAALYRQNKLVGHPVEEWLGKLAVIMLQAIGVQGEPISPETRAEVLRDGGYDPSFLTGTVQPITMRGIIVMLLSALPTHEQRIVSTLLSMASDDEHQVEADDERRTIQRSLAQAELLKLSSKALDSVPDAPLFYVHLGASQRSIIRDLECQIRAWKKKLNVGTCKVHSEKLKTYLDVWDLREGWTGSGYDRSREASFADVTRQLKTGSISTTVNRYRSAFLMITGNEFSPALWWRLFGPLQFPEMSADSTTVLSAPLRRRFRSPVSQPVPESKVSPRTVDESRPTGIVQGGATIRDDIAWTDLVMDLKDLINRGLSDQEIAEKLELESPTIVATIRMRITDFDSI
jgi:hypothetical protein